MLVNVGQKLADDRHICNIIEILQVDNVYCPLATKKHTTGECRAIRIAVPDQSGSDHLFKKKIVNKRLVSLYTFPVDLINFKCLHFTESEKNKQF